MKLILSRVHRILSQTPKYCSYSFSIPFIQRRYCSHDEGYQNYNRIVAKTQEEYEKAIAQTVTSPTGSRLLKVAIIGLPNSGKSTLINALVRRKVCSVSKKVHTTKSNTRAFDNVDNTQLIFLDTPGIITTEAFKKYNVKERSHLVDPELSFLEADLVAVVHDANSKGSYRNQLQPSILKLLALNPTIPCVLILNKIDLIKKRQLLEIIEILTDKKLNLESAINSVPETPREFSTKKLISSYLAKSQEKSKRKLNSKNMKRLESNLNKIILPETNIDNNYLEIDNTISPPDNNDNSFYGIDKTLQSNIDNNYDDFDNIYDNDYNPNDDSSDDKFDSKCINNKVTEDLRGIDEADIYNGNTKLTPAQAMEFIKGRTGWPNFQEVFMISALKEDGVNDFKEFLLHSSYSSPWIYHSQLVTDQNPYNIAIAIVREKMLNNLPLDAPYNLKYQIGNWNLVDIDYLEIAISVECQFRIFMAIMGPNHLTIKKIKFEAEQTMRHTFGCAVRLSIDVNNNRKKPGFKSTKEGEVNNISEIPFLDNNKIPGKSFDRSLDPYSLGNKRLYKKHVSRFHRVTNNEYSKKNNGIYQRNTTQNN